MYSGVSVGPIYKTIENVLSYKTEKTGKTRNLWAGSFIFSYIVREIIKNLIENGVLYDDFITPYVDENLLNEKTSVGKFHDRIIVKCNKEKLNEAIEKTKTQLAKKISKDLNTDFEDVKEFVDSYFKFYTASYAEECNENEVLEKISEILNTKELFFEVKNYKRNYFLNWIRDFSKEYLEDKFQPLHQIAVNELGIKLKYDEDLDGILKNIPHKPYHKYVAIIHADGDNLSKALQNLSIKDLSRRLFKFSNEAIRLIKDFKGEVIYAGGDDLLFFVPVKNQKTLFSLLHNIEKIYNIENSTLSFGVSITYYKYPLIEALNESRSLLHKAKKWSYTDTDYNCEKLLNGGEEKAIKNNVAFKVVKHSGQFFTGVVHKEGKVYDKFLKFVEEDIEGEFLHSIYVKFATFKEIIKNTQDLTHFFENNFNENYEMYKEFFEELNAFVKEVFNVYEANEGFEFIYSTLRFMKFLKGEK